MVSTIWTLALNRQLNTSTEKNRFSLGIFRNDTHTPWLNHKSLLRIETINQTCGKKTVKRYWNLPLSSCCSQNFDHPSMGWNARWPPNLISSVLLVELTGVDSGAVALAVQVILVANVIAVKMLNVLWIWSFSTYCFPGRQSRHFYSIQLL